MKKIILVTAIALALFSCKTSSVTATKLDRNIQTGVKGNWVISSVSYPGSDYIKVNSFQLADSKCFEGSTWHLVQNNASGNYTLNGGSNCPSETTKIKWFITETNGQFYFNFKKIYEGEKPKNVVDGYKMRVASNTGSSIVLAQELSFEGSPLSVFYTFTKN